MAAKIRLDKGKVIVFMGSMNAMPMMYALDLKALGYEVLYFVDAPRENTLCRPEYHYSEISYPYPDWIIEVVLPSQILLPIIPRIAAAWYERKIARTTKKKVGCFVLNGFFTSLAPYLCRTVPKVGLSHGSDLDVWADTLNTSLLSASFRKRSIFRYLPGLFSVILIKLIVERQYFGYLNADVVLYFPAGFSEKGDRVVNALVQGGVGYVPRYDMSFEPARGYTREYKKPSDLLVVISAVRFKYITFPDGCTEENKGNDLIIDGLAKYYRRNRNLRIHFIEKGEDVGLAKALSGKLGLKDVVVWHKEMPLRELLSLYTEADVCFDQVGSHWIGAIGGYALYLGKPLIANPEAAVRAGVWPIDNPVCSATSSEGILHWLTRLEDSGLRSAVSRRSKVFVEDYFTSRLALKATFGINTGL